MLSNLKCFYLPLVENVEAAKALKIPENLKELKSYVLYMKDKSGIGGWTKQQQLLQVKVLSVEYKIILS